MIKHIFKVAAFLFMVNISTSFGLTKVVVFPLQNKSDDENTQWISGCVAESFQRTLPLSNEFQLIDPTFLFSTDSCGWSMNSDSLLKAHWLRWGWNVACGGNYSVSKGIVSCEIRLIYLKNGRPQKKNAHISVAVDSIDKLCLQAFDFCLENIGYTVSKNDRQLVGNRLSTFSAKATYCSGYVFEMKNNLPGALTAYNRCIEIDPGFSQAYFRMARLYRIVGSMDAARKSFSKALSLAPGDPIILAEAADFMVSNDPAEKALDFIKKNRGPLELTAAGMTAIGKSLLISGELQRAIAELARAVAKGPSTLETDFMLGRAYLQSGEISKATDVFNRLIKYQPDCARFYALLGAAYRLNGRIMESLKILEYGNSSMPQDLSVQVNLAQTYFDLSWFDKSEIILEKALRQNPEIVDLYVDLGVVYWFTGKKETAQNYFNKASKMGKNIQSAINNTANIFMINGQTDKAIDLYKKADKIGGKNEAVLSNLAKAYFKNKRLTDAALCYDIVLSISPDRLDVLQSSAQIAEIRKKETDAINYYRKILEVAPHHKTALFRMIDLMKKQGQIKQAIEPLEAYLNDFPVDKQALLIQAGLYRAEGWYEVAIMKYQSFTKDFPDNAEGFLGLGNSIYDMVQFKNGHDYDKAIYFLKTAADLDKSNPEPEFVIGKIYLEYKNYRELALESFKAALPKATDPVMKKNISDYIEKAGK